MLADSGSIDQPELQRLSRYYIIQYLRLSLRDQILQLDSIPFLLTSNDEGGSAPIPTVHHLSSLISVKASTARLCHPTKLPCDYGCGRDKPFSTPANSFLA